MTAPRLVIAAASGDAGKTLVSLGLILQAGKRNFTVRAFKKGPDYIDAAWLGWASGAKARNLDTFLMGFEQAAAAFASHAGSGGLNLIEGNRGLFDGLDARGTHSTAELAKLLQAPVVLVVNAAKVTRSAAAWVLGCQKLDPDLAIAGVVLNRVASARHERVLRESIESVCRVPVLGAVPKVQDETLLPSRHLGLVPPEEHDREAGLRDRLSALFDGKFDVERLVSLARQAPSLKVRPPVQVPADGAGLKIGYLRDSAFTFYYPENLEALEAAGVRLEPISSLAAGGLPPDLDALYVGGGFPETHAARISQNTGFLASLAVAARSGLPVYAECGGLMLLARAILWEGARYPMAGVFPFDVEVCKLPQGHGYTLLTVDAENPFYPIGTTLRGHEFHYSRILAPDSPLVSACRVDRGTGSLQGRDGLLTASVWASYTHLHALGAPAWSRGMIAAARKNHDKRIRNG